MVGQPLLRDPDVEPTGEVIARGLGAANAAFVKFINTADGHGIRTDWRYYRDGNTWFGKGIYQWTTNRGTSKEMTVFWLSIWDGFFKATIYFSERLRGEISVLPLSAKALDLIGNANSTGKLRSLPATFDFDSDELFGDFFALAEFKKIVK